MKICELSVDSKKVEASGKIIEVDDIVDGAGWSRRNTVLQDSSGTIMLQLWNEDIQKVQLGDQVKIENGYVKEYQGKLQLSTGKWGKLTVVGVADKVEPVPSKMLEQDIFGAAEYHLKMLTQIIEDLKKVKG